MRRRRVMSVGLLLLVAACDRAVTGTVNPDLAPPKNVAGAIAPSDIAVLGTIVGKVNGLVAVGTLNSGTGTSLVSKVNTASTQFLAGNTAAAKGALGAFTNQVSALQSGGVITPAVATTLTTLAAAAGGTSYIFTMLAAGDLHTCGLATGGYAYCWGLNTYGQLGNGTNVDSPLPVLVSATQTFSWIGGGSNSTCALTTAGQAMCWGGNQVGELGNGTVLAQSTPVAVSGGHTFTAMSTGNYGSCGTTSGGSTYCWGAGGRVSTNYGGLAATPANVCVGYYSPDWPCSLTPIPMTGGQVFVSTRESLWHGCGITVSGVASCWGWGQYGQNGDGTQSIALSPVTVSGAITFAQVEAGATHTCGLDLGGTAFCWGGLIFQSGQLGNGVFVGSTVPVPVSGGLTFKTIRPSKGNDIIVHTCAVASNDDAYCWGANSFGQLGAVGGETCIVAAPDCASTPKLVSGGLAWTDLATGAESTCGLTTIGEAYCWGYNAYGQLGDGTTTNRSVPTLVVR